MNKPLTIEEIMSPSDRVEEAYFAIMEILEQYKCKFDCSLVIKGNDQHFYVDVVLDEEKEKVVS